MQTLFAPGAPWAGVWMECVLSRLWISSRMHRRLLPLYPATNAEDVPGTWKTYYRKWECVTHAVIERRLSLDARA
jgi:hypothetical protein